MQSISFSSLVPADTLATAIYSFSTANFVAVDSTPYQKIGGTYTTYYDVFYTIARSPFGSTKLLALSPRTVALWRDGLISSGHSSGYVKLLVSKLRILADKLVDYELIKSNYFRALSRQPRKNLLPEPTPFTVEQVSQIFAYLSVSDHHRRACLVDYSELFSFQIETGMRINEILNFTPEDLREDGSAVFVRRELDKARKGRLVYLSATAIAILSRQSLKSGSPVFSCKRATAIAYCVRMSKKLGFRVTTHLFRHTCFSTFAAHTSSIRDLMTFSGHTSIGSIQTYLHADRTDAKARVTGILGSRGSFHG